MKTIFIILLCSFSFANSNTFAQSQDDSQNISTISIAVAMPYHGINKLTDAQISILEDRIKNIVSMNGLSAEGGLEGFVIYPKFDIYAIQEATATIKTITIAKCNLSLFVRQFIPNAKSNIVFDSYTKDITGTGYTESEAIANALTQIRPDDDRFQQFLNKTKDRIVGYYTQNCDRIVNEAQNAANLENYDKAFALLLSIPKEATQCYSQVQQKTVEIYLKKQKQDCEQFILKARTYSAAQDYDNALDILRKVDPESVCKEELLSLINDIESKVDAKKKAEVELYKELLNNAVEIEKSRNNAIGEMAKAYLQNDGRRTYTVNGSGPNANIQVYPAYSPGNTPQVTAPAPKDQQSSIDILATTTLKPLVSFENNIFPSFILSAGKSYNDAEDIKKYGDKNSCLGISIINPNTSGTLSYEIEPVENKYFDKVTGTISFTQNQSREYFPEVPWKFDALRDIQQSTPLSIKFRLIDKTGKTKEDVIKVNVHSIRECIIYYALNGKSKATNMLAAYVNEENPHIDKLLKEGIDKNWVTGWTGYQDGAAGLDNQVKAIWKILSSKGIKYSDITGSTTSISVGFFSQTVRPFCESIYDKQANCVDGSLVFASILQKIGIRPVLVLIPGHCFLAYHKTHSGIGDDDLLFLETTVLGDTNDDASEEAFNKVFNGAKVIGADNFIKADKSKTFIIDIGEARRQNVNPINLSDNACK